MRKEYSKALRKIFALRLKEIAPAFKEVKITDAVYPGQRVYKWSVDNNIACFVILVPHQKWEDQYTFELGWSKSGRLPTILELGGMWPSLQKPNEDHMEYSLSNYICRVGSVSGCGDIWWSIGQDWIAVGRQIDPHDEEALKRYWSEQAKSISDDEAEEEVSKSLDEAIELLKKGILYLERFVNIARVGG